MSLIQMHRSPSRLAAWLGLLAIMLLFIAPVISKSLASAYGDRFMMTGMQHAMPMPGMSHEAMENDSPPHPMISMTGMTPAEHARMLQHHPMSMMDDSACGYCVLLAHLPLDLNNLPPLWSALQVAKLPATPLIQPLIPRLVAHFFRPRAPPAH